MRLGRKNSSTMTMRHTDLFIANAIRDDKIEATQPCQL